MLLVFIIKECMKAYTTLASGWGCCFLIFEEAEGRQHEGEAGAHAAHVSTHAAHLRVLVHHKRYPEA
jgi:hypothetical protein